MEVALLDSGDSRVELAVLTHDVTLLRRIFG